MQRFSAVPCALLIPMLCVVLMGCPVNSPDPRPQASFDAEPVTGEAPLTVQFTDRSTPGESPIQSWQWFFGDGSTSSRPNPEKTFYVPSGQDSFSYTVRLTVTSARGSNTITMPDLVYVRRPATYDDISGDNVVQQSGVTVTVPESTLDEEVSIGIAVDSVGTGFGSMDNVQVISDVFTITHTNTSDLFSSKSDEGNFVPATLALPFDAASLPGVTPDNANIQILVSLPSGLTIPILGQIQDDEIVASVLNLPKRASYAVVYRSTAYELTLPFAGGLGEATDFDLLNQWRVNLTPRMLTQLTALRLGEIDSPEAYDRSDFTDDELETTEDILYAALNEIRDGIVDAGVRAPVLAAQDSTYSLVFFNMNSSYSPSYDHFADLAYLYQEYGQIVIDPMQLLTIARHNALAVASDATARDLAQEMSAISAFAEAFVRAVFAAHPFPEITELGPSDLDETNQPKEIHVLAGLREGLAAYAGQWGEALPTARGFDDNEYALLSQPLFAPFHDSIANYAVSGQDFLVYLLRNRTAASPMSYLLSENQAGWLTSIRTAMEDEIERLGSLPNVFPLEFSDALRIAYTAMDEGLWLRYRLPLAQAYWDFVRGRAIEVSTDAAIRPSDRSRTRYVFDESLFDEDAIVRRSTSNGSATFSILSENVSALEDIHPLSARAIVLTIDPRSTSLEVSFDTTDWLTDTRGNSVAAAAYVNGLGLAATLGAGETTLEVDGLPGDADEDPVEVILLVANLNLTEENSVSLSLTTQGRTSTAASQALDQYVHEPNPDNYTYELTGTEFITEAGVTAYTIDMTSGLWRSTSEVDPDQQLWTHPLIILKPPVISNNTALLFISGGNRGTTSTSEVTEILAPFVLSTGSVAALIKTVPNQPLVFAGQTTGRTEDEIIAYSFDKFMDGVVLGVIDNTWPALFPMTRSAVRAMDTVQDFMQNNDGIAIDDFVVSGASKRGWTTWLTAAADVRVKAIMPMVIDILNMQPQIQHHHQAYGTYSSALEDYVDMDIFSRLGTAAGSRLLQLVDPYSYRSILDMPKFIINSTGDEFFLPDAAQFYFNDLPGEKYLYYAANTNHSLSTADGSNPMVVESMVAFHNALVQGMQRPVCSWTFDGTNRIVLETSLHPVEVRLWEATNTTGRDFRLYPENVDGSIPAGTEGPQWESSVLHSSTNNYVAEVLAPSQGWKAFYVEASFSGYGSLDNPLSTDDPISSVDFKCCTQVRVIPDVYPAR